VRADEKLTAFIELERQVLTVTFYLASIHTDPVGDQMTVIEIRQHRWGWKCFEAPGVLGAGRRSKIVWYTCVSNAPVSSAVGWSLWL
jgi:hypothetical protein